MFSGTSSNDYDIEKDPKFKFELKSYLVELRCD